jgi:DNA-binding winged helix-turn-helix (wHTH) protein
MGVARPGTISASMKKFPPFQLDLVNQCLWQRDDGVDERRILLAPKAFAMLAYFVEHAGRLVTQEELLDALWSETYVQPEVLKSHIRDIRAALGDDCRNPRFIETLSRRGYQFIAPLTDRPTTTELAAEFSSPKIVGRQIQLGELRNCLRRSLGNRRQVVFITGGTGIGKTTLVDEFLRQAAADFHGMRIARGQCVEGFGGKEAYYPMLEALSHLCRGADEVGVAQALSAQAPAWLVQLPALMRREQRRMLQPNLVGVAAERMLREIGGALETIASEKPLLLVFEDLHWADPSTVDLISALARRRGAGKLMLVGTYRSLDLELAQHPLKAVKQDLLAHQLCREIALERLTETEVAAYLAMQSAASAVPEGLAALVHQYCDGNPLFMVAGLEHLRNSGLIAVEHGSWQIRVPLRNIHLEAPESLRQLIELQVERLSVRSWSSWH